MLTYLIASWLWLKSLRYWAEVNTSTRGSATLLQHVQEHSNVFDSPNQSNLIISDSSDTCGIITISSPFLLICCSSQFLLSTPGFQLIFCLAWDPLFTLFLRKLSEKRAGPWGATLIQILWLLLIIIRATRIGIYVTLILEVLCWQLHLCRCKHWCLEL